MEALVNLEVEQAVLGALLSRPDAWALTGGQLKPNHFGEALHARIFDKMLAMHTAGQTVSAMALVTYLNNDEALKEVGGQAYLAHLTAVACINLQVSSNAMLIRELASRREAIVLASALSEAAQVIAMDQPFRISIAQHIESAQRIFEAGTARKTSFTLSEAGSDMLSRLERIRTGEVDRNAIKTGLGSLDRMTGGLRRGEFCILGGRPSMGKTALAVQLAMNVAEAGSGVFYASLEMPTALLTPRLASAKLWTPGTNNCLHYQRILRGDLNPQEWRFVQSAAEEMKAWPFVIDDAPGLNAPELEARAQIAKAKFERAGKSLDLIVVDHLHKMRHAGAQSKVTEFTEISSRLAEMAKRLDCPVLALAQLNRGVESRDDKRPQLADLRESGSIEQDADTVMFVYRPSYYLDRERHSNPAKEADRMARAEQTTGKLELIIEKQRSGPIGTVELWCDIACNVVRDVEQRSNCGKRAA